MLSRNPLADLEAIAAMPGLEQIAEVIAENDRAKKKTASDPLALTVLLAAHLACGSETQADSLLRYSPAWEIARASAARVGRILPEDPPTKEQWRHYRQRATEEYSEALADALVEPSIEIARMTGLLTPGAPADWASPERANSIYADGSVFKTHSDVYVDEDGEVVGSRAKHKPRIGENYVGKKGKTGKDAQRGLPVSVVGCHGGQRHHRVILGVKAYTDGDELAASFDRFDRVIAAAGGGVHAVHYDSLMSGVYRRRIMRLGAVPIVEMAMPQSDVSHVPIPPELQKYKGKDAKGRPRVKTRARSHYIGLVTHNITGGQCAHEIHAVDGTLRAVRPGTRAQFTSPHLRRLEVARHRNDAGYAFHGRYQVPCSVDDVHFEIDFTADRKGGSRTGERAALAEWVSIVPESDEVFTDIAGRRSDVESTYATMKGRLAEKRATRLHMRHFLADVVGAALWVNAVAWDVHAARHTRCGQRLAQTLDER